MTNSSSIRLDVSRWTRGDWITGIGTLILLVSLFLPWFGISVLGFSAEADGLTAHGYLYLVLVVCLAITGYLVAAASVAELPGFPLTHRQRLLAATGLNAALVLLAFLIKPTATSWRFGAFAAVIAALAALAPQVRPAARTNPSAVPAGREPGKIGEH